MHCNENQNHKFLFDKDRFTFDLDLGLKSGLKKVMSEA
jgi:hypothetical protein